MVNTWLLLSRAICRRPDMIVIDPPPAPDPLQMRIVLRPDMDVIYAGSSNPSTLGYYPLGMRPNLFSFINLYTLLAAYLSSNPIDIYHDGGLGGTGSSPGTTLNELVANPMTTRLVDWQIPSSGYSNILVANGGGDSVYDGSGGVATVLFKDIAGNEAGISPVLFSSTLGGGSYFQYYHPTIQITVLDTNGYTVTLGLERIHNSYVAGTILGIPPQAINFYTILMDWLGVGTSGIADITDPTNTDKVIVTLPRGTYNLGAKANYKNNHFGITEPWYSAMTMVLEVF